MSQNITAPTGTDQPEVPCRALVSTLGWIMELQHLMSVDAFQETNELLFDTFIQEDTSKEERQTVLFFYKTLSELSTVLNQLTKQETVQLNAYLLNVCQGHIKNTNAA